MENNSGHGRVSIVTSAGLEQKSKFEVMYMKLKEQAAMLCMDIDDETEMIVIKKKRIKQICWN
eukprot:gnl/Chilomastix_caulleri/3630.p1 GENE.gnl/Chilomastix_caulleri/3630~~gnl/Chilomastix_caulleri/3630.p1  ORF type:complete len:63 (+),score=7.05 gnl/Chilomastix_caulleri/3630:26-214(+)